MTKLNPFLFLFIWIFTCLLSLIADVILSHLINLLVFMVLALRLLVAVMLLGIGLEQAFLVLLILVLCCLI